MASNSKLSEKSLYAIAAARIGLGFIFLWAFFDKLFGLGFATCRDAATNAINVSCDKAWLNGGSPTTGYLDHATKGPFADFYQSLAGHSWVDYLFMAALLAVGVGLVLGIAIRLSVISGILLMIMMWSAALWPENNPLLDDHIIYALLLLVILYSDSNQKWGLRAWWHKMKPVKNMPLLQ